MRKIRVATAAIALLLTFVFAASAEAAITSSNVTTPADGSLLMQNLANSPNQTFTVSGTTNGTTGDLFDIDCFQGNTLDTSYRGPSNTGIALTSTDGSFTVTTVPEATFGGNSCHLLVVPYGTTSPGTSYTGPRVGFSDFSVADILSGANTGTPYDYNLTDATTAAFASNESIDDCGPYTQPADGTSAMNAGPGLFDCAGNFYNSPIDFFSGPTDRTSSEIQIDGKNAYGSASANHLFTGSNTLAGFPALTASLDSFDSSTGNAQTTESEPLVKCTPSDVYDPTSSDCTAFASTGVAISRVTSYSNSSRVATVTDTFSSTDGSAHSIDLEYETDLNSPNAGWELPGQTSFSQHNTGDTGPSPTSAPGSVYAIYDTGVAPSLSNPVGAMTFTSPYTSVSFDNTLWASYDLGEESALFDYQRTVPASGSTSITWTYATGTSLAEVQGYAAAAQDAAQAPSVTISSPANGATETHSPVSVNGSASAGSGVKSVTVNGVAATVSGGTWSATLPLTRGHDKLTATVTSNAGNTATASVTVTYAPPPRISVKSKRFKGKTVLVKLACAASGSSCRGKVTLRYTETVIKHHKKHKIPVVIASKRYSIGFDRTATVKAGLNGTGKRLLKAHHKLATKGTVTVTQANGHTTTGATFKLTLK
jgi:hypothetical protein